MPSRKLKAKSNVTEPVTVAGVLSDKNATPVNQKDERLYDCSEGYLTSERLRVELIEAAALDLVWGPWGPTRKRLSRITGTVGKNGEYTEFTDGVLDTGEKLDRFIDEIERLWPRSTQQLHGLKIGDHVHPLASLNDLVVLRWREVAIAELTADRAEIASEVKFWSERRDLSVFDIESATKAQSFGMSYSNLTHLNLIASRSYDRVSQSVEESISSTRAPGNEVQAIVNVTLETFPSRGFGDESSRLVIIPTTVAAALAENDKTLYSELGVQELTSEIITKLETAERLQKDRGVYVTIRSAWEAAKKL
jgi:hypothetical protein